MQNEIANIIAGMQITSLGAAVAAAGALGTACFGIVEGLKWTRLGEAGFSRITQLLGQGLQGALAIAYGPEYERLLRAQYREDWAHSDLPKTLRQGVRLGLSKANAATIAGFLGAVNPAALETAATNVLQCLPLSDADRAAIARFEAAVDARIESALALSQDTYVGTVRMTASVIAMLMAVVTAFMLYSPAQFLGGGWLMGLLVGTLAVPLAPIANDVVNALRAASKALGG
jgi:hypothetical protein